MFEAGGQLIIEIFTNKYSNMPKLIPQYKDDAKRRIILAALEVVAESGYEKLTMDDVAKKIGATKGAIYWYFQNKNALIQELLETIDAEFRQIASDPFFDQMKDVNIPPALNRLVFNEELKKEIYYEIGFLNSHKADIPVSNPEFIKELITILETQIGNEQKKEQLPSLSDKKILALSLAVLFSGLQRGEIYTILFFGRTRIQQMWFTAMKKLLNCELGINLIKKYSL